MSNIKNILIAGVGGQGVVLSSDIIVRAGLSSGYDLKKSEVLGMSQRGGPVLSHVRMGDKIYSPVVPKGGADLLVSMEEMETLRWAEYTRKDTIVIYARYRILPSGVERYPEGAVDEIARLYQNVMAVDAGMVKRETGNIKYLNAVLTGILANYIDINEESWAESFRSIVPGRTLEHNLKAFRLGRSFNTKQS